ncbi:MAG TPA: arsenate reductase ArsC [Methylibium sp.]|nr:arsenate reductase ArsC [Methylibium sp.]
MNHPPLHVLFLCTHNAARSLLAEALLNHVGRGRFVAHSAGSQPRGEPHPLALRVLREAGIPTAGLASKSWDVFGTPDAPKMDLVITVCDNAAGETCPYWPGQPATAHWGYADPSVAEGDEAARLAAFHRTMIAIRQRLELLVNLPATALDRLVLQQTARGLASS